jgi:predicted nucleic acid-binding protein
MAEVTLQLGRRPYIDANIVVYAVEGYAEHESAIRAILAAMDHGELVAATSELTLAEVLVKPKQEKNAALQQAYREFLEPSAALALAPITQAVLVEAAEVRATTGLKLPDAIHVATALALRCDVLLTNDRSLRAARGIPVRLLSDVGRT